LTTYPGREISARLGRPCDYRSQKQRCPAASTYKNDPKIDQVPSGIIVLHLSHVLGPLWGWSRRNKRDCWKPWLNSNPILLLPLCPVRKQNRIC